MPKVIIIGSGISGLTTAFWLHQNGVDVTVVEKNLTIGGVIQTEFHDGFLVELGPNSALETSPLIGKLLDELGIKEQQVYVSESAKKRYILRGGELHAVPMSPGAFLKTKLWTAKGKLRLLKEPFVGRAEKEESIAEFVIRRLGQEFLDYAINPFVAGVYAGNPEQLSVQLAFPKLYALEKEYGGLIKGMIGGRKKRKQRGEKSKAAAKMFSFQQGLTTLTQAIGERLQGKILTNASVRVWNSKQNGNQNLPAVEVTHNGSTFALEADAIVFATPAYVTAEFLTPFAPQTANLLQEIYYPPVAMVFTGYKKEKAHRELDGFGYLIPQKEKRSILGTIWSSTIFPNRAPEGHAAFTTFVGGSRQSEILENDDKQLLNLVTQDLFSIMNVEGQPDFVRIKRWQKAIPQYNLGYAKVIESIERLENDNPGLYICSNYRGGISVGDTTISADRTVSKILQFLSQKKGSVENVQSFVRH
jgi:oxygen-dependent protoporphyrinogen oxidase